MAEIPRVTSGIFEGIRVIELGMNYGIPFAGRILAAQGAEVIMIETNKLPQVLRQPPWIGLAGSGAYFPDLSAMKLSISLDLRYPEGQWIFKELIKISDVVTENFSPEAITEWGVDYETLKEVNPRLIYVSGPATGVTGPFRHYRGYGLMVAGLCGMAVLTGTADSPPQAPGLMPLPDALLGSLTPGLVAAALDWRERTGRGVHIELPLYLAGATALGPHVLDYVANRRVNQRMGDRDPYSAPHNVYPCQGDDRWCAITCFSEEEWQAFCRVIGNPEWTRDPKFATLQGRKQNEDELDRLIGEWTINQRAEDIMEMMQQADVPAGMVQTAADLVTDPHLMARNYWRRSVHPIHGPHPNYSVPIGLSDTPFQWGYTSRTIGEHNQYVYGKLLGISEEEIKRLTDEKVFV
jgi:benzylsuccinate CoA-transferase BbsF subunit